MHDLARERDKRHPQICRNTFLNAARYHGNASSEALQFALARVPPLLEADDATLDDVETGAAGDYLVTQVTMSRSRQRGTVSQLRLVPKGALVIEPDEGA